MDPSRAREVGRPFGVPLRVDLRGVALLTATNFAAVVLLCRIARPDWPIASYLAVAAAVTLLLQLSAAVHEYAHLLVALRLGQRVPALLFNALGGCMLLDPGRAEEGGAPADPPIGPTALLVAAGPAASFVLWVGFAVMADGLRATAPEAALVAAIVSTLNFVLLALNLLPLEPLDGGRLLRLGARAWRQAAAARADL